MMISAWPLPDVGHRCTRAIPPGPLSERIRFVNRSTGARTSVRGWDRRDPAIVVAAPEGLNLHAYRGPPLSAANAELRRLFAGRIPKALSPYRRAGGFVALFWDVPDNTLERMLSTLQCPGLDGLLRAVYVPLIAQTLGLTEAAVLAAPSEVIHYPPGGGLEQHIDNVTRTGNLMGPVCSVCFVTGRAFDLLPALADGGAPFRLWTEPGDLLVLDGAARALWSHAVPYDADEHRYSVVIRPMRNRAEAQWLGHLPAPLRFAMTDEEARYVTLPDDAVRIQRRLANLWSGRLLVDAFACVGGDTLAAALVHRRARIVAVQRADTDEERARFGRLVDNVRAFRPLCHRTQRIECVAQDAGAFLGGADYGDDWALYLDPPWERRGADAIMASLGPLVFDRLRGRPRVVCTKLPARCEALPGYALHSVLGLGRYFAHFWIVTGSS